MFVNNVTQVYVPSMVFDANSNQFIWLTHPNYYQCQFVPNYGINLNSVLTNGVNYYPVENYRVHGEQHNYNQTGLVGNQVRIVENQPGILGNQAGIVENKNNKVPEENIGRPTQNYTFQFNGHSSRKDQCYIKSETFCPNKTPQRTGDDEKKQQVAHGNENKHFTIVSSGITSRSERNKENNPPSTSYRQERKNRTRCNDGLSETVQREGTARLQREQTGSYITKQLSHLHLLDRDLARHMLIYTLRPQQLLQLGFPVVSSQYPGKAIIYKESHAPHHTHSRYLDISENFNKSYGNLVKRLPERAEERRCVRCLNRFYVSNTGEYISTEQCLYHWGKLLPNKEHPHSYSCCKGKPNTRGCTVGKQHVWNGIGVGTNGPLEGFVCTRPRKTPPPDGKVGVYALDCEMCYTNMGLELSRITVVAPDGRLVYDTIVRPDRKIIDYNSRFSGISARDYEFPENYKSLREVQNDLMCFINADTILIGHGLNNDLRALKMIHTTCVDTSVVFPHRFGLPYRRSLKSLATYFLKTTIQTDPQGHDSSEDARTCIALMLYRIEKDFRAAFSA